MKLVVGSKCYSSWSLRPWLLMRVLGIPFEEELILLRQPDKVARIRAHSPAGRVPILKDGGLTVWDSLSILEYLAEAFPEKAVWPKDRDARALARSISAEMHSGFQGIRNDCPMNLAFKFGPKDRGGAVAADTARIAEIWRDARERFGAPAGGPFLFGAFTAADAMYAPVVTRFETYSLPADAVTRAYMDAVLGLPAFQDWRAAGLAEPAISDYDEIGEQPIETYRKA